MPDEKIGMNLLMCIPPDHLRHDAKPPIWAHDLRELMDMYSVGGHKSDDVVKVVIKTTDGRKTAKLPCVGLGFDGHELSIITEVEAEP